MGYLCDNIGLILACPPSGSTDVTASASWYITKPSGIPILSPVLFMRVSDPYIPLFKFEEFLIYLCKLGLCVIVLPVFILTLFLSFLACYWSTSYFIFLLIMLGVRVLLTRTHEATEEVISIKDLCSCLLNLSVE